MYTTYHNQTYHLSCIHNYINSNKQPIQCPTCEPHLNCILPSKICQQIHQKHDHHQYIQRYKRSIGRARLKPGNSGQRARGVKEEWSGASPTIIQSLHSRFQKDMEYLLAESLYVQNKQENLIASNKLQLKMKHGSVQVSDFNDPGSLWGYCKHKMTKRALLAFEAFRVGAKYLPTLSQPTPLKIASIGGGPGNDLYGVTLFRDLCCDEYGDTAKDTAKDTEEKQKEDINQEKTKLDTLLLFDFVSEAWYPIVNKLSAALKRPITCQPCDVQQPLLNTERNVKLLAVCNTIDVFTFSFVLHEAQNWNLFLTQLWEQAKIGAIFYFKDPSDWQEKKILLQFQKMQWIEGEDYFWVLGDGLLVHKRIHISL